MVTNQFTCGQASLSDFMTKKGRKRKKKTDEDKLQGLQTLTTVNHFYSPRPSWPDHAVAAHAMPASSGVHYEKNGAVSHAGSLNSIFCFISHT